MVHAKRPWLLFFSPPGAFQTKLDHQIEAGSFQGINMNWVGWCTQLVQRRMIGPLQRKLNNLPTYMAHYEVHSMVHLWQLRRDFWEAEADIIPWWSSQSSRLQPFWYKEPFLPLPSLNKMWPEPQNLLQLWLSTGGPWGTASLLEYFPHPVIRNGFFFKHLIMFFFFLHYDKNKRPTSCKEWKNLFKPILIGIQSLHAAGMCESF